MSTRSGVSIVPLDPARAFTGPLILSSLIVLACPVVRLFGLDHLGITFCYFKATTGHACLTCGSTRAFGHLARFDPVSAFAVQPLVTAGVLFVLVWGLIDGALRIGSKRTRVTLQGTARHVATAVLLILAALNWIYLIATGV